MKFRLLLIGLTLSFSCLAQEGDDAFIAARDAFRAGDAERLELAAGNLGNSDLAAYVDNYRLRLRLDKADDDSGIPAFLASHPDSNVGERLRADWLRWLGRHAQWTSFESAYPKLLSPDQEINCYHLQARLAAGDVAALDDAKTLWLSRFEPPDSCRPVLDALAANDRVSATEIWARARRQMEINRPARARKTLLYLPESERPDDKSFDKLVKNAMSYLVHQNARWSATPAGRELTAFAIQRLATGDPQVAAEQLAGREGEMDESERQWAWSEIALVAAKRHLPEAGEWYALAGVAPLSDDNWEWKARAALRAQAWGRVRDVILAMPPRLAGEADWIYWLGRAYKAGGLTTKADALFEKIADQPSFYGNLAAEELGRAVQPPPRAEAPRAEELQAARDNPGLRRALHLFRLDMHLEGVREWNWALRGMDDRQLLAAAHLAKENEVWDRVINTANLTRNEHDYTLRYLAPFGDQIRPVARDQALDDAWVYGLMRQESRFVTSARSGVGASGLMQLMPATARWVARKIGLRNYRHSQVTDPETNVLLGTNYMRLVMENLDNHPVLASAAYNAGPSRARRWLPDKPLEGAIYAETIPFSETRDYVKKVMSNAVYYSVLFHGKPDSLKARLGVVGALTVDAVKNTDLP